MNGVDFFEEGDGYPLILLHGFCETKEIWRSFARHLSLNFKVISMDLPGFGNSEALTEEFTLDQIADVILTAIEPWKTSFPVVIGHSLGGYVALAMAKKNPGIFGGVGLFHSTAYADNDEKKEGRNKVMSFVQDNGVEPFVRTFVPGLFFRKDDSSVPAMYTMAMGTRLTTLIDYALAMRDRRSSVGFLSEFKRPILFLAGEKDTIIPVEQLKQQSQLASQPLFVALKDTGHMGMLENESQALNAVEDFMNLVMKSV